MHNPLPPPPCWCPSLLNVRTADRKQSKQRAKRDVDVSRQHLALDAGEAAEWRREETAERATKHNENRRMSPQRRQRSSCPFVLGFLVFRWLAPCSSHSPSSSPLCNSSSSVFVYHWLTINLCLCPHSPCLFGVRTSRKERPRFVSAVSRLSLPPPSPLRVSLADAPPSQGSPRGVT